MVAMETASDKADDFIDKVGLVCNKSRQAAITRESAEIEDRATAV
ncbi:MAG: hypothetical protein OXR07_08795 [Nitrospira sp.]|nr:hypothetical protein [Nitrospira sp.]MDD9820957.1 hypothetical protein [Nitrospira sp.]MDD9860240.1 hypothetical protein [Nitrospira sp.]